MADAKALFMRHWKEFNRLDVAGYDRAAMIYGACIIAEAIRTEQDLVDYRAPDLNIIGPDGGPKEA